MKKIYYLFIILVTLTSCFNGRTKNSNFYNIIPVQENDEKITSKHKLIIAVEILSIANYLDRPEIVMLKTTNTEFSISDFHRWIEPLSSSLQRVIATNLSQYFLNITANPLYIYRRKIDYSVLIYINRLDGKLNNKAYFNVWYSILDKDNNRIFNERLNFEEYVGNDYNDFVRTQSILISRFSRHIANVINNLKK